MQEFITCTMDGPQVPLAESKLSKSNGILVMVNNQAGSSNYLLSEIFEKNIKILSKSYSAYKNVRNKSDWRTEVRCIKWSRRLEDEVLVVLV